MDCSPPGSCSWDSPGKNTGVGNNSLLQGIFPIQGSNLCLLHLLFWQVDFLPLHHLASHEGCVLRQWGSATEADPRKAVSLRLFSDHTLHVWTSSPSLKSDLGLHLLIYLTTAFRTQRHQEPKQFASCLPLFHLLLLKICFRYTSHLLFFKLFNTIFRGYFPLKLFNLHVCWSLSPLQDFCVSCFSCLYLLLMLPVTFLVAS